MITLVLPHYFNAVARSGYVNKHFRRFCSDYGMPITIIAATGLAYWGRFNGYVHEEDMTLPVTRSTWTPAAGRSWLVPFWSLDAKYVGIALPFGLVLFILFYFDANVSVSLAVPRAWLTAGPHRSRLRVPAEEASGVPLGLLLAGRDDIRLGPARDSRTERSVPLSRCISR